MRLIVYFALSGLGGCGPAGAVIGGGDTATVDTNADADTDSDADADADADADSDADTDADPANQTWVGTRDFTIEGGPGCEETVNESGPDVTRDPIYADAVASCTSCDQLFLVTMDPTRICNFVDIASPAVRGVDWRPDGSVVLFRLDYDWHTQAYTTTILSADTHVDGPTIDYVYDGYINNMASYHVDGTVTIQ